MTRMEKITLLRKNYNHALTQAEKAKGEKLNNSEKLTIYDKVFHNGNFKVISMSDSISHFVNKRVTT